MKQSLICIISLVFTLSSFATSLEISSDGGYYNAWIRQTINQGDSSHLYDLYKSLKSDEISAPTQEGIISRKVLFNSARNYKFACVVLDNFKLQKTIELICEMNIARFTNNNYEAYYYELPNKEIDMIFHGENAAEMIQRLGIEHQHINIDNKVFISGDDFTLNFSIRE
jgi:hypothetical protein